MDLEASARTFGVELNGEQKRLLRLHLGLLKQKNEVVNLTSSPPPSRVLDSSVLDPLSFLGSGSFSASARV